MEKISTFVSILFILTTFWTVWQFFKATGKSKKILIGILIWTLLQAIIGLSGFYRQEGLPPRFVLLLGPVIIFTIVIFLNKKGKEFIDSLDIKKLTILHTARIPVEFTLYYVFMAGLIPQLMTFEGNNFDILSGISAPIIYYFVFVSRKLGNKALLIWNFVCLGLLINVLTIAVLSAKTPFQQLALEQPNIGVTYFPFVWLPAVVVPLVLFSHLAGIWILLNKIKKK